jgi:hypothetical protein
MGEVQVLAQEVEHPHQLRLSREVAAEQVPAAVAPEVVLVVVLVAEAEEAGVGEAVGDRPATYLRLLHHSLPIPTTNACYAGSDCLKRLVGRLRLPNALIT